MPLVGSPCFCSFPAADEGKPPRPEAVAAFHAAKAEHDETKPVQADAQAVAGSLYGCRFDMTAAYLGAERKGVDVDASLDALPRRRQMDFASADAVFKDDERDAEERAKACGLVLAYLDAIV